MTDYSALAVYVEQTIAEQKRTIESLEMQNTALRGVFSREEELQATITNMEAREKMYVEVLKRADHVLECSGYHYKYVEREQIHQAINSTPSSTSEWAARFVAEWVRENWPVRGKIEDHGENGNTITYTHKGITFTFGFKLPSELIGTINLYAIPDKASPESDIDQATRTT
jgi:septal ring factor EnvC (AmiA/AmiB activator)